jgi:23S rRNA pseudouridine955/2504/2580 synthase
MVSTQTIASHIIFEDSSLLVLNKPAGLAVHGDARQSHSETAISLVKKYLEERQPELFAQTEFSPSFMHRLDKETSGALVLAKTREALQSLNRQLKFKKIQKLYWVLVKGEPKERGSIRIRLSKQFNRKRWKEMMVVDQQKGMHAQTDYRFLEKFELVLGKFVLVEAQPITGRMHQIRAHFSAIQHPVVGDVLYGDLATNKLFLEKFAFARQFLHCARLRLLHPSTQSEIEFSAPLAPELESLLGLLRVQILGSK